MGTQTFRRLEEARWRLGDRVLSFLPGHLMVGDDVLALQERLTGLGFSPGRPDGIFGRLTDHAVREFQLNTGLPTDGTAGPDTFRALGRLTRTVSGGASTILREQQAFDVLRTGVTHKVVLIDAGPGPPAPRPHRQRAVRAGHRRRHRLTGGGPAGRPGHDRARHRSGPGRAHLLRRVGTGGHRQRGRRRRRDLAALRRPPEPRWPTGWPRSTSAPVNGRTSSVAGQALAELLLEEIAVRSSASSCGAHPKTWELLRLTRMPAVHLDLGYLTNPEDGARLGDPDRARPDRQGHHGRADPVLRPAPAGLSRGWSGRRPAATRGRQHGSGEPAGCCARLPLAGQLLVGHARSRRAAGSPRAGACRSGPTSSWSS